MNEQIELKTSEPPERHAKDILEHGRNYEDIPPEAKVIDGGCDEDAGETTAKE